ncbi:hypothetical protein JCM33374_g3690 [Metschnikowia sp. JCM 33374]|nr:hypothetical protein JCM33374_g3690 [Metschnikowia sp. JCM 33374]
MPLVLLSANLLVTMATSPDLPVLDEKLAIDLKPTPHSLAEQVERAYNAFFTSPDYQKTESTSNIAQMMKSSLEPIFERLRSFTRGAEFNYMEFDSIVDPLAKELQIISDYVEKAKDINQELFQTPSLLRNMS